MGGFGSGKYPRVSVVRSATCAKCEIVFTPERRQRKYCSAACQSEAASINGRRKPLVKCASCEKEFYPRRGRTANVCCSRECGFAFQAKQKAEEKQPNWMHWWFRDCTICGVWFCSRSRTKRTCSQECRSEDARRRYRESYTPVITVRPCPLGCGRDATGREKFCPGCSTSRKRLANRNRKHARSRAKSANVIYAPVSRAKIIERHGTRCWICKGDINMSATAPNGKSFSVDHVVPLSVGGWHDLINLRPAHLGCNRKRGARYAGQLMLRVIESTT